MMIGAWRYVELVQLNSQQANLAAEDIHLTDILGERMEIMESGNRWPANCCLRHIELGVKFSDICRAGLEKSIASLPPRRAATRDNWSPGLSQVSTAKSLHRNTTSPSSALFITARDLISSCIHLPILVALVSASQHQPWLTMATPSKQSWILQW
jgi:hypothetical protein